MPAKWLLIVLTSVVLVWGTTGGAAEVELASTPKPLVEIATGQDGRLLEVPVRIGPREYSFVVDTGSALTCFGQELTEHLGPPVGTETVMTHGGKLEVELHRCPPATWAGLNLNCHAGVTTTDLAPVRQASGRPIDGVLGMDVLQHYVLRIDFDTGRMQVFPPIATTPKEWGERIPLHTGTWLTPAITATLGNLQTERCHIDTGANVSTLTPALADELSASELFRYFRQNAWSSNPAGRARSRSGRLVACTVAGQTAESLRFDVSHTCSLGLNVLSRFHLTLDFPGQSLQMLPGRRILEADQPATSGLAVAWVDSKPRVLAVQPGSPAESAGLRPGDVLRRIDDLDTAGMDSFGVGRLLTSQPGRQLRIVVVRGNEQYAVKLRLAARPFAQ